MPDIKVIGMTGPTGAGKSSVAKAMREAGLAIIDADEVARYVVSENRSLLMELAICFGVTILNADGELNRKKLGQLVFGDRERLDRLNKIIFPFIRAEVDKRISSLAESGEKIVILDAPTLFESGADKSCDAIVVVTAPLDERLNRIVIRDRLTDEDARRRMKSQYDDGFYTARADYIIENNTSVEALIARTHKVINIIKSLANEDA